jgi:flagellar protein FliS
MKYGIMFAFKFFENEILTRREDMARRRKSIQKEVGIDSADVAQTVQNGELIIKMYDGAIKYCNIAIESTEKGDREMKEDALQRAYGLINELRFALDFSVAPQLCQSLDNLYRYMEEQIVLAKQNGNPEPINQVVSLLSTLKGAWDQVVPQLDADARSVLKQKETRSAAN